MSVSYSSHSPLLRLKHPLIQGGMGVGISMGGLAGAVAREGGMGVISTANIGFREKDFWDSPDEAAKRSLQREIRKARAISGGRGLLAVNIMVVTSNYHKMAEIAVEEGIDAIISGAGLPLALPDLIKNEKVMAAPIVSSAKAARTIINFWHKREELLRGECDSLEKIVSDIKGEYPHIPIFAAGGVFDRNDIEKVMKAGAYGVQIATRFIAAKECDATDRYKEIIIEASGEEAAILQSPVGMPGRGLLTPLTEKTKEGVRVPPQRCIR